MSSNPYSSKSKKSATPATPVEETAPVSDVPTGSVKEVLAWVGEDRERAQEALEAEKAGAERKTLLDALEDVLDD